MKVSHCNQIGCRQLVPQGTRYCPEHAKLHQWTSSDKQTKSYYKQYNKFSRDQEANDFYHSREWQVVRKQVLIANFYSDSVTGLPAINNEKLVVDHVVPLKLLDSKQQMLNQDNLWVLSQPVHTIKTRLEQHMSDNQLKHCSKSWWTKTLKEKLRKDKD